MAMRLLRLVLAVLVVSSGLLLVTSGPAMACSCASEGSARIYLDSADDVVTGTLVEIKKPPPRLLVSSGDPVTYLVDVDAVFKGDLGRDVAFTSARDGASCGLEGMTVGVRYLLFLYREGDRLSTGLCSGNAKSSTTSEAELVALTGPARAPSTDPTYGTPASGVDEVDAPLALPLWVLGAGTAGIVGFVGSLWLRLLRG
jgi:hypothetical protein